MIKLRDLYPPRPRPRDAAGRFRALTKEEWATYRGGRKEALIDLLSQPNALLTDLPWKEAPSGVPPLSWRR